jgi:hypothetical protein
LCCIACYSEDYVLQFGTEAELQCLVQERSDKECVARLLFLRPRRELENMTDWKTLRKAIEKAKEQGANV